MAEHSAYVRLSLQAVRRVINRSDATPYFVLTDRELPNARTEEARERRTPNRKQT